MKEILEAFAISQGWVFEYGRADFNNLFDAEEQSEVSHLFLDPVEISKVYNDTGDVDKLKYSGSFMLLYSSSIDEVSYNYRYVNYIKPIVIGGVEDLENNLICENYATLEAWKMIEVINVFDYNLDGILVNYIVSIDQ